jgi:hypothetical protein
MTDIIRTMKFSWKISLCGDPKTDPGIGESPERAEAEAETREMAWIAGAIAATESAAPRRNRLADNTLRD